MKENICRFVSTRSVREEINIIHFVYEKQAQFAQEFILPATYTVAFVTSGVGALHTPAAAHSIGAGDIFLLFSAKPYYIENLEELHYMYITFTGIRAPALIERLHLSPLHPVYPGHDGLRALWESAMQAATEENIDLICEGVLLYTLAHLRPEKEETAGRESSGGMLLVKQYIDQHFTDCALNLNQVSRQFAYNPKYLSMAFKKMVQVSFTEYLARRRLDYARSLIENGHENIKELSELCGYNDPLYFSKAFKKKYGVSPKQYGKRP